MNLYMFLFVILNAGQSYLLQTPNTEQHELRPVEQDFSRRKWITELFNEAKDKFYMNPLTNNKCKEDFDLYLTNLQNQSVWAVRMMESAEWPSVGIFTGMVDYLGNYEECLKVSSRGIRGQYCLAQVTYNYDNLVSDWDSEPVEEPDEMSSVWNALRMYRHNPNRVSRNRIRFAVCIPSSCTPLDLEEALNATLYSTFYNHGVDIDVEVNPKLCSRKIQGPVTYPTGYHVMKWIIIGVIMLVIASTSYDMFTCTCRTSDPPGESNKNNIYVSFSVIQNFKNLTQVKENYELQALHLLKCLGMVVVIYFHQIFQFMFYPKGNMENFEKSWSSSMEVNHTNGLDIFIMITGFITFHYGYTSNNKRPLIAIPLSVMLRWLRLVPVYVLLSLFIIHIAPHVIESPLWNFRISREIEYCQHGWWQTIFAIQNFYPENQCLGFGWYIALDIQLAIIGEILLHLFSRSKRTGLFALSVVYVASIFITFIVVLLNKYEAVFGFYLSDMDDLRQAKSAKLYWATYGRVAPYLIGFLAAFLVKTLKEKKFKFSTIQILVLSSTSFIISEATNMYVWELLKFGRKYNQFEHALYAAVYRTLNLMFFVVHYCFFPLLKAGLFSKLNKWNKFVVLGRLSYMVCSLNLIISNFHMGSQTQIMPTVSRMNILWWTITDVVFNYLIGFILHLILEAPIINLVKILRSKIIDVLTKHYHKSE